MEGLKRHLDLIIVVLVVLALVFYDLTFELFTESTHFLLERSVELFEWVELGIEIAVEHVFHTSHHGAQIGTFYILLAMAGFLGYRLWHALPRLYGNLKQTLFDAWRRRKTEWELYWISLTLSYKLIMIGTALLVAYLASFFVM